MTTTTPGLAERAVRAVHAHRAADPDGFHHRHDNLEAWNRWARRARVARTLATALRAPVDQVIVTDDPHRTHRTRNGPVPGDLITLTDATTGQAWRFIPDHTTPGQAWLLLDHCHRCATEVPVTRLATLADLGDHLTPDLDTRPADECRATPRRRHGCIACRAATTSAPPESLFAPINDTDERCTVCGATNTRDGDAFDSFGGTTEWWERCTACGSRRSGCDLSAVR